MNSRFSVGNDIVEIGRIRKLIHQYGQRFFKHIYTDQEVEWCNQRMEPSVHLAGRFAAKEAVKKALMALGEPETIPLRSIEIFRDDGQPPKVELHCELSRLYRVQVSISHTDSTATAVAFMEVE